MQIGLAAVVAIVALRLGVGWQFYSEGVAKLDGKPFSAGFLRNANGPLAPLYQRMVWDADGRARLDREGTIEGWNRYRDQLVRHFGLNDEQSVAAEQVFNQYASQLTQLFDDNSSEIRKYLDGLDRRDRDRSDPALQTVESLKKQAKKREADLRSVSGPWLARIDAMWHDYEQDLMAIAGKQPAGRSPLPLNRPARRFMDSIMIDSLIPYFDMVVGGCLVLGLFTRTAGVLGALFMCSVIASQPPGFPGSLPVFYELNLMLGLLVLAATGAGRFAGLDFFLRSLRCWCCPPKRGNSQ